jgi:hypothetical protein
MAAVGPLTPPVEVVAVGSVIYCGQIDWWTVDQRKDHSSVQPGLGVRGEVQDLLRSDRLVDSRSVEGLLLCSTRSRGQGSGTRLTAV